jgi:LysM repeat protein
MAYQIASGDTLSGIAQKNNTTVAELMKLNPNITDANKIYAGQSLNLSQPITQGGEIKLPEQTQINPDISASKGVLASNQSLIDSQQAEVERKAQQIIDANNATPAYKNKLEEISAKFGLIPQKREQELTDLGFEPTAFYAEQKASIAELNTLYDDYNATVAQRDQQIADVYGRPGQSMDFLNNQVAQINRNANVLLTQKSANINTKTAIMEAKNSNWDSAQKFVNQAISDYTAGLTADYEMATKFYDDNQDLIDSLGKDYSNALKERNALILDQIQTAREDYQFEINRQMEQQGLDISLMNANTARINANGNGVGVSNSGVANSKIEASFREDGGSLKAQIRAGALTNEEAYAQLRDLYSPTEVTDEYINNYLGIATTTPSSETITPEVISYGTGNFSKTTIENRISELSKFYEGDKNAFRKKLISEGYNVNDVKRLLPTTEENIGGFFQGIYNSIFGK